MSHNINALLNGRGRRTIMQGNYALAEVVRNVVSLKAPRFISFIYETEHEISAVTVLVGYNLERAYRRDLATLTELKNHETNAVRLMAMDEIIASLQNSLEKGIGNNDAYTCKNVYTKVEGNGSAKVHDEFGMVYLQGSVVRKRVLAYKKERKTVNSAEKTIIKNQVKKDYCKLTSFRQYKLDATSLTSISFAHNRIIFNSEKYNKMAKIVHERKAPLSIEEYRALVSA